jgi:hypothetical protein
MDSVKRIDFGKVIPNASTHQMTYLLSLSDEQATRIRAQKEILWVYGYIAYRDFLEKTHRSGFVATLEPAQSLFYPSELPEGSR